VLQDALLVYSEDGDRFLLVVSMDQWQDRYDALRTLFPAKLEAFFCDLIVYSRQFFACNPINGVDAR
jgi:hypothetical protein